MTTAEYKALLDKVESSLNKLEPAFKGIDPSKTNISYTAGKQIEGWRDTASEEVAMARQVMTAEPTARFLNYFHWPNCPFNSSVYDHNPRKHA